MANEKRLIDLDATLKRLEKESWWLESVKDCIRLFLAKAKTVDAVEVVRCKDCTHSRQTQWYSGKLKCCHNSHGCSQVPYEVSPEHFCSYGERKDNDDK